MKVLAIEYWALWIACTLLLLSCLVNLRDRNMPVPNRFTLPTILVGWVTALVLVNSSILPSAGGGFLSSLAATIISLVSLLPLYVIRALGAGSVKMQMGFGAWVGCSLPLGKATLLVGVACVVCTIICTLLAVLYTRRNPSNCPEEQFKNQGPQIPAQPVFAIGSIGTTVVFAIIGLL
jgi:Flp pilus assembly protein protease CpaA